jgi:hypothetical protein
MKYICLGYFDERKSETMSVRRNGHSLGSGALQTARIATILRSKNGLAEQKLRAALHAAEFATWQAIGGDFLRSTVAK